MSVTRPTTVSPRRFPMRRMLVVTPLVVIAMGAAIMGARARLPDNQIAAGVHVGDLDLGGKTLTEARPAIEQWAVGKQSTQLALRFGPDTGIIRTWKPDAAKLGLGVNVDGTLDAANKAGRESFAGQVGHLLSGSKAIQVAAVPTVDDARLKAYLKRQIAGDVNRKPKNARFVLLKGGAFGTHHEQNGIAVDVEPSAAALKQAWTTYLAFKGTPPAASSEGPPARPAEAGDAAPAGSQEGAASPSSAASEVNGPEAALTAKVVVPPVTITDLNQINSVLGAKSSYVNGTESRLGNIRIAASHINGTLLKPGDVFSYNEIVGPREEDGGYREAPILIRGKHDKGIAGGICQTSGTLFNAVLHSGLKIVQREHHSTPIGYLPIGLDATVAYGSLDFKFQNNTEAPVYVAATLRGRELTFTLFGKEVPGRHVSLVRGAYSRTGASYDIQTDRGKPAGYRRVVEGGSGGCRVTWYRVIKENGQVVHRDVISSHYSAHPGVMLVGTGARAPKPGKNAPRAPRSTPAVSPGAGGPAPPSAQSDAAPQL